MPSFPAMLLHTAEHPLLRAKQKCSLATPHHNFYSRTTCGHYSKLRHNVTFKRAKLFLSGKISPAQLNKCAGASQAISPHNQAPALPPALPALLWHLEELLYGLAAFFSFHISVLKSFSKSCSSALSILLTVSLPRRTMNAFLFLFNLLPYKCALTSWMICVSCCYLATLNLALMQCTHNSANS